MTSQVVIAQEYVPHYRRPLFDAMRAAAPQHEVRLQVAAGAARARQDERSDSSDFVADIALRQHEWSAFGRRFAWRNLRRLYKDSDLVVVEQARRNLDVHLALRDKRAHVALWGHGRDYTQRVTPREEQLLDAMTMRAHWFFGYTPESVDHVVAAGYPRERTTVLYNSTDTDALRSALVAISPLHLSEERTERGLTEHTAVFVGALDESKRLDFLLAACDLVASRLASFRLVVAGDGPLRHWLAQQAASRPWLYLFGRAEGKDLALVLALGAVVAMPGRVGLIAVDALAAGTPVVTTAWPHHAPERAYLTPANSVCTADDVDAFAVGLLQVLNAPKLCRELAAQGIADAAGLSTSAMATRFMEGIRAALDAS